MNSLVDTAKEQTSAGHLIVKQLESMGVERAYCVPGESYLDVLDGLYDSSIQAVVCRQEGGAGIMALAEGRLTGLPGVAMVTRGPGAANAMISVHTAWQDATPMLLFVGLVPTHQRGLESFQEFSLEAWFGTTTKKVYVLDTPERAAEVVADAMHIALSGRPGPVVIGLPEEILRRQVPLQLESLRAAPVAEASTETLSAVETMIGDAQRPLIIAGGEQWHSDSADALAKWAETRAVPVATDFRAYDVIDNASSSYVGMLGHGRDQDLSEYVHRADLIIFLGAVRSDVLSDGYSIGTEAKTVVVTTDPEAHGHFGRIDLQLLVSPSRFVEQMAGQSVQREDIGGWLAEGRSTWAEYSTPLQDGGTGVDLSEVMESLQRLLPVDTVVTYGAGNYAIWPQRFLAAHQYPSVVAPKNGAMGVGIPAAVAASLIFPDRQVVSVAGDGCFMMNGQELSTAVAHRAKFVVLVVDNSCYGTIRQHQEREYPGRPSATSLVNPDFAALARACGAYGRQITDAAEFESVFAEAISFDGPALLHLVVDSQTRGPAIKEDANT